MVDDKLTPVNANRSPYGAWWVPILEKAAAKFFGTYENINGGRRSESLYLMTGMPTIRYTLKRFTE